MFSIGKLLIDGKRFLSVNISMLSKFIKQSGIRQNRLARYFGISPGYLSHLIAGNKRPSLELAVRVELLTGGVVPPSSWFADSELVALGAVSNVVEGDVA